MWLGWRNVIRERHRPGPRWAAAQDAADAATARYHDAQTRHAEIVLTVEEHEAAIRSGRDRARVLRMRVQQLAVTAYTTAGGDERAALDDGLSRQRDDLERQRVDAEQALADMDAEARKRDGPAGRRVC